MGACWGSNELERQKMKYIPGYTFKKYGVETVDDKMKVKKFHEWGVSIAVIEQFIEECGGAEALTGLTTRQVVNRFMVPAMRKANEHKKLKDNKVQKNGKVKHLGGSYAYHWKKTNIGIKGVHEADIYVIHAWEANFLDMVETIRYSIERRNPNKLIGTYVWVDVFCMNQCKVYRHTNEWYTKSLADEFKTNNENINVKQTMIILSPWDNPILFKRSWCLMETYFAIQNLKNEEDEEEGHEPRNKNRRGLDDNNHEHIDPFYEEKILVEMTRAEHKLFDEAVHEDSPTTIPYTYFNIIDDIKLSKSVATCKQQQQTIYNIFKVR